MAVHYVKIYYGPNDSFYTMSHKPQKLHGLRDHLLKLGFRVDLAPVEFVNYCMLEMCGHEVCATEIDLKSVPSPLGLLCSKYIKTTRCNIKNLSFNMPPENDPVCRRAVNAVVESSAKFLRARTYLWLWSLIEEEMFRRSEYAPKDYWPFEIDKDFSLNLECPSCCGFFKQENSQN